MFIDYLRERHVWVISATEGIDTFRDEDDLIIGVRGLMNDYHARDIGKKIRAGYRQKQKEGLVITPPFGYWKDRNTNQVLVYPEAAETVQLIYALYLQGCGQKEIARRLNALNCKTPAQLWTEQIGHDARRVHKTGDGKFLWTYASVKMCWQRKPIPACWSIIAENISAVKREPSAKRTGFATRIPIRSSLKK